MDNHDSVLLIIDIQGRLATAVQNHESLFLNVQLLAQASNILAVPIIYTEQAPHKIGRTPSEITDHLSKAQLIEKMTFSCWREPEFQDHLKSLNCKNIIVAGVETHVCVYQTVKDLLDQDFQIELVADAVSSRANTDRDIAIQRIQSMGAHLTSAQMVVCEWLITSEHPKFKNIMSLIKSL